MQKETNYSREYNKYLYSNDPELEVIIIIKNS